MVETDATDPPVERGEGGGHSVAQFYRYVLGIGHERNVGGVERAIRYASGGLCVVVGVGLLVVPVLGSGSWNAVLALGLVVTGLYLIYEAQVKYCPLNRTVGRSTYSDD